MASARRSYGGSSYQSYDTRSSYGGSQYGGYVDTARSTRGGSVISSSSFRAAKATQAPKAKPVSAFMTVKPVQFSSRQELALKQYRPSSAPPTRSLNNCVDMRYTPGASMATPKRRQVGSPSVGSVSYDRNDILMEAKHALKKSKAQRAMMHEDDDGIWEATGGDFSEEAKQQLMVEFVDRETDKGNSVDEDLLYRYERFLELKLAKKGKARFGTDGSIDGEEGHNAFQPRDPYLFSQATETAAANHPSIGPWYSRNIHATARLGKRDDVIDPLMSIKSHSQRSFHAEQDFGVPEASLPPTGNPLIDSYDFYLAELRRQEEGLAHMRWSVEQDMSRPPHPGWYTKKDTSFSGEFSKTSRMRQDDHIPLDQSGHRPWVP